MLTGLHHTFGLGQATGLRPHLRQHSPFRGNVHKPTPWHAGGCHTASISKISKLLNRMEERAVWWEAYFAELFIDVKNHSFISAARWKLTFSQMT